MKYLKALTVLVVVALAGCLHAFADQYNDIDGMLCRGDLASAESTIQPIYDAHSVEKAGGEAALDKLYAYRAALSVLKSAQACEAAYKTFQASVKEQPDLNSLASSFTDFLAKWNSMVATKPFPVSKPLVDRLNAVLRGVGDMQTAAQKTFEDAQAARVAAAQAQKENEEKAQQDAAEKEKAEQARQEQAAQGQGVNGWQWETVEGMGSEIFISKAATPDFDYPSFGVYYQDSRLAWWGIALSPDLPLNGSGVSIICQFGKGLPKKISLTRMYGAIPGFTILAVNGDDIHTLLGYRAITVMIGQGPDLREPPFVKYRFDLSGLVETMKMAGLNEQQTDEQMMQTWQKTQ